MKDDIIDRVSEIDRFFQGSRIAVHRALRALKVRLDRDSIPYAVVGGMAINAHGHEKTTNDVDVLLSREGYAKFQERWANRMYVPNSTRRNRFHDQENKVPLDFVLTGGCPRFKQQIPICYPDPEAERENIGGVWYAKCDHSSN